MFLRSQPNVVRARDRASSARVLVVDLLFLFESLEVVDP
jgi:hypothetical protein